ncbi:MAG: MaoC family dehydratase N-terminal domain-containing protein [Nocardioides sp.]
MVINAELVGRAYPPTSPYTVTREKLREFAAATAVSVATTPIQASPGQPPNAQSDAAAQVAGERVPATFPIVLAFDAMFGFLDAEGIDLSRIVHGDQKFSYERAIVPGDVLTATLTVASVRSIGGNDIIGTRSEVRDASGSLVCTTAATLVHRAPEATPAGDA